ncbi:outer membrane lipoprotein carrier protein LolA [Psychromonas ossibalaenae]|uniref:outer membrane lipoprotein carrier protein LolA n=1 Tax=Psychromonas ossibalaenae TaxID=444922 RepID=UPI0003723A6D|nr:outer membrane lipoprotein carrier protein LolA [Psychromonas ossibalaenae]
MLIKKVFFTAVLVVFSFSAQAVTLADVQQKLTTHSLLRGEFTQTKTMQMFNQPLVSKGKFLLQQDQGLLWKQVDPFSVSLVLVKDKLSQQFAEQAPEVIAAKDNPMVFYFSHLFLSLFKGDVDGLTEQFEMKLSEKGDNWLLLLTPKSAPLNKVFANISIEGSEFIDVLVLNELSGDVSEIKFAQQTTTPNTLSKEEQRAFQF